MFTGALGAETACLIRRLRAFYDVASAHTTCVATSATIVDRENPDAARNFSARFFGVEPDSVTTVGENYKAEVWGEVRSVPPTPGEDAATILDGCVDAVEAEVQDGHGVASAYHALSGEALGEGDWQEALHTALSRNELVFQLNTQLAVPRELAELPQALKQALGRPVAEAEILARLTLGAASRRDGRPLLRPIVHGFVRGISGAVVSFPRDDSGARLWLAAEDELDNDDGERRIHFPVTTCTTCGQHYYIAFLKDFIYTGNKPEGGEACADGPYWEAMVETEGGKRVVLLDRLIGADDEHAPHARTTPMHFCRHCGSAHPDTVSRCGACGEQGKTVPLHAVRQGKRNAGNLTSCLSCSASGRRIGGRYREPARPVRAINVADVHVLT